MEESIREKIILQIIVLEKLTPSEEGVELNEGYRYSVDGSLPQLADSLAKLFLEMDKDENLGENSGSVFLEILVDYYHKLKGND